MSCPHKQSTSCTTSLCSVRAILPPRSGTLHYLCRGPQFRRFRWQPRTSLRLWDLPTLRAADFLATMRRSSVAVLELPTIPSSTICLPTLQAELRSSILDKSQTAPIACPLRETELMFVLPICH